VNSWVKPFGLPAVHPQIRLHAVGHV